jgi:hypothetical protein
MTLAALTRTMMLGIMQVRYHRSLNEHHLYD